MMFASDNWAGASPKVLAAVAAAMSGPPVPAYGKDDLTQRVGERLSALFEREVAVFLVASGTAANVLSIAHLTLPWGAVYCHAESHLHTSECGASEAMAGLKLVPIATPAAKVTPGALAEAISQARRGDAHSVQPATLSITNLAECGTLYTPAEVAALGALCRDEGLAFHMDGARFANAVAALGCTPADLTWKAGVDALSLGATKNGAVAAEAAVFFDPGRAEGFQYRRMRGGQLLSKMRFVAAQFEAWVEGGHWLELAGHANAMARMLADGLAAAGVRLAWEVEGNELFPVYRDAVAARLLEAGARFHPWPARALPPGVALAPGETIHRHVCSFATTPAEVAAFLALVRREVPARAHG